MEKLYCTFAGEPAVVHRHLDAGEYSRTRYFDSGVEGTRSMKLASSKDEEKPSLHP